ncbi:MAG: hypothetical protein IT372_06630 [Polyangiaceae bacterium]|nr:hypothetical protein [Polyangiaceae bacterium]
MDRTEKTIGARALGALALVLSVLLAACDDGHPAPGRPDRPEQTPPAVVSAPRAAPDAPASAAPNPSASASAGAPAGAPSSQGSWGGSYDAKKGSVELPPKVKDPARSKDSGKLATGHGTVTLTIDADGELRGKARGALGDATLVGKAEGEMIRASVFPDDPRADLAMTGILVGKLKGDVIEAQLRVTGPDATLVRESPVELKRK